MRMFFNARNIATQEVVVENEEVEVEEGEDRWKVMKRLRKLHGVITGYHTTLTSEKQTE